MSDFTPKKESSLQAFLAQWETEPVFSDLQLDAWLAEENPQSRSLGNIADLSAHTESQERLAQLKQDQENLEPLVEKLLLLAQEDFLEPHEIKSTNALNPLSPSLQSAALHLDNTHFSSKPSTSKHKDSAPQKSTWQTKIRIFWQQKMAPYAAPIAAAIATLFWLAPASLIESKVPTNKSSSNSSLKMNSLKMPDDGKRETLPHELRVKGSALSFYIKRGDKIKRGQSGDEVLANDALRFVRTNGPKSHFLLFSVDEHGNISTLYPLDAQKSQLLQAGVEEPLPQSWVLDDAPNDERILALFSKTHFTVSELERLIAEHLQTNIASQTNLGKTDTQIIDDKTLHQLPWPGVMHMVILKKSSRKN